jgi:hypothetical protein
MPYHIELNKQPIQEDRMRNIETWEKALKMAEIARKSVKYRWGMVDVKETKPKTK